MKDNIEAIKELKKRCRIVWVNDHEIVGLFLAAAVAAGRLTVDKFTLRLPVLENLPHDILFDHVFFDPVRSMFGILILHDTFKIVPDGEIPPQMNGTLGKSIIVEAEIKGRQSLDGNIIITH